MSKIDIIKEESNNDMTKFLPIEFTKALIGYKEDKDGDHIAIYDESEILKVLVNTFGMNRQDAIDHYKFNIKGSLGKGYPEYMVGIE